MDTITTIADLLKCDGSARPVTIAFTSSDSRLIAAAPDLLEACTLIGEAFKYPDLEFLEDSIQHRAIKLAQAALRQAKGETP